MDIAVALAVAGLLGAAAHRGGLCTVRAVAELVTTRRGHILWSFLKASLWTTSILAIAALAGFEAPLSARPLGWWAVAGGFLFGMGAALNGACALSTFARLGEGHVSMAFAPLGWIAGIAFFASDAQELHPAVQPVALPGWLALPALAWIGVEGGRLCRRLWRDRMGPVGAPFWPLSLAVLVVAAAYATLLLLGFRWSFTATALCTAGAASLAPCRAAGPLVLLSAATFAGMLASAEVRRTLRSTMSVKATRPGKESPGRVRVSDAPTRNPQSWHHATVLPDSVTSPRHERTHRYRTSAGGNAMRISRSNAQILTAHPIATRRETFLLLGATGIATLMGSRRLRAAVEHRVEALNIDPTDRSRRMIYNPEILRIAPGDRVNFVPVDRGHNVESFPDMLPDDVEQFRAPINEALTVQFAQEGTHAYFCQPHRVMGMMGLVLVGDFTRNLDAVRAGGQALAPRALKRRFDELIAEVEAVAAREGFG